MSSLPHVVPARAHAIHLEVAMKRLLALPAIVLLTATCRDAARITQPDSEPPGQLAQLSPAVPLAVDPVTVTHADTTHQGHNSVTISNDFFPKLSIGFEGRTWLRVPMFDPTLGKLLSARLVIEGWLASEVICHAQSLGFASSECGFGADAELFPDRVVEGLIGIPSVHLRQHHEASDAAFCVIPGIGPCPVRVEVRDSKSSRYDFDRTYLGADADVFVQSAPGGELTFFTPISGPDRYFSTGGHHSGLSLASLLQLDDPLLSEALPDEIQLIRVVAALVNMLNDHGTVSTYSDLHAAARAQFQMQVIYVYQPNRPPVCSEAVASVGELWPPNHRLVPIDVLGVTDPDGDPVTISIAAIMQDEPTDAHGDGRFTPDGMGIGTSTAEVRAERAGTNQVPGNGRVYHIGFSAADGRGGVCSGTVLVGVPHDRSKAAVDEGPRYNSTQ